MALLLRASWPRLKTSNPRSWSAGSLSFFRIAAFNASGRWSSGSLMSVRRSIISGHIGGCARARQRSLPDRSELQFQAQFVGDRLAQGQGARVAQRSQARSIGRIEIGAVERIAIVEQIVDQAEH